MSTNFTFRAILNEDRNSFAVYGDLGVVNAQSLQRLINESQRDFYDSILHVGDMGYSKHSFSFASFTIQTFVL